MEKHITILGALYVGLGAMGILAALLIFVILVGSGLLSGDAEAAAITSGVGVVFLIFFVVMSAPGIIGGVGLLKRKSWSRVLVIILACLNLLGFPFGTALGIYALWTLTRPETPHILSR